MALVAGVALLAAPSFVATRSAKAVHLLNWLLRFGGANPYQTFERYIQDSFDANRREFDDAYRDSLVYVQDFDFEGLTGPFDAPHEFE